MNASNKHTQSTRATRRRSTAWSMTVAVLLAAVLLGCASCTRNDDSGNKDTGTDTTAGTTTGTTPGTTAGTTPGTTPGTSAGTRPSGGGTGGATGTGDPMDPDAGTVNPDGGAGNPPAATDKGDTGTGDATGRFRSRFMY